MRKRIVTVHENVISVDFSSPEATVEGTESGGMGTIMRVVMDLGEVAYADVSDEEELTGLNKSTIGNRALQLYHLVMEKQREGRSLGFLDEESMTLQTLAIDDTRM